MSRGKINNNQSSSLMKKTSESFIDRLNNALGRLMGKKSKADAKTPSSEPTPNVPSNNRFILIILAMLIVLWGFTGFYYVPDASYGMIVQNGKLSKVVKGLSVGVTLPYPFSDVITIDNSPSVVSFGLDNESSAYQIMTSDEHLLEISGQISYRIVDPQKYFLSYYQENTDLDQRVSWLTKTIIQDYFLHHNAEQLLQTSNIVTSNEIRKYADNLIENYGIKYDKLTISSIHNVTLAKNVASSVNSTPKVNLSPNNILSQANSYQAYIAKQTESMVNEYNQLLPQYHANKKMVAELMYYKMLSSIPRESVAESFPLLDLSHDQFLAWVKNPQLLTNPSSNVANRDDIRQVNRDVNRGRSGRVF